MITIVRREIHVHTFGEKVVFITGGGGGGGWEGKRVLFLKIYSHCREYTFLHVLK